MLRMARSQYACDPVFRQLELVKPRVHDTKIFQRFLACLALPQMLLHFCGLCSGQFIVDESAQMVIALFTLPHSTCRDSSSFFSSLRALLRRSFTVDLATPSQLAISSYVMSS